MERILSYRTADDGVLLLEESTIVFRLSSRCERLPAELGVSAGKQVRVELHDDSGHLLDSLTYVVPPTVQAPPNQHRQRADPPALNRKARPA